MTQKYKSLADAMAEQKAIDEKWNRIKKMLGRDTQLPKKLIYKSISFKSTIKPEDILLANGYIDIGRGWIKKISKDKRFHAFFLVEEGKKSAIFLHTDKTLNGKHRAFLDGVEEELVKIKKYIKSKYEFSTSEELTEKPKEDILPRAERISLLKDLGNPIVKKKRWFNRLLALISPTGGM